MGVNEKEKAELFGLLKEFNEYMDSFKIIKEREAEIEQLKYAILLGEHILLKGKAGVAKSFLAMNVLRGLDGAKVFKQQFTAFMDESYVFGPQLIEELKKGNVVHNTENSLIDADFAFLDEFFNANEETIVSCNEILNERTFTRNKQYVKSPLITAIMTTNQDRENEKKLIPIYDRIMFKASVGTVENQVNRLDMYSTAVKKGYVFDKTFGILKIFRIRELIEKVDISVDNQVLVYFDLILREYQEKANKYISDRLAIKSLNFLKLVALNRGRDEILFDDLRELFYTWATAGEVKELVCFETIFARVKVDAEANSMDKEAIIQVNKLTNKIKKGLTADIEEIATRENREYLKQVRETYKGKIKEGTSPILVKSINELFEVLDEVIEKINQVIPKEVVEDSEDAWLTAIGG